MCKWFGCEGKGKCQCDDNMTLEQLVVNDNPLDYGFLQIQIKDELDNIFIKDLSNIIFDFII